MRELASRWAQDDTALEIADWQHNALESRHRIAWRVLHGMPWTGHPSALHLWQLPEGWSPVRLSQYASKMQIELMPDMPFPAPGTSSPNALRISLGGGQEELHFRKGLELTAALLKLQPTACLTSRSSGCTLAATF